MQPGAWGESQCTYERGLASDVPPESDIPFASPARGRSVPDDDVFVRKSLSAAPWARTPHDICSPIWNGIGSGKDLTLNPPHRGHQATWGGFYSRKRSNLFQSHWSNQWLTNFSYR